ncbi:MAG: hypothetical protein ABI629_17065 [bacterium]
MRTLLASMLLLGTMVGAAAAQCCGDCAGDGAVTIDDLITAVRNSLAGCPVETPTAGPSQTPTLSPTPTRTPIRCPRDFTDTNNQCTFNGRYNVGCGSAVTGSFAVNGTTVVVTINTGIANPAVVRFSAQRDTATHANLTAWSSNNFQTVHPVAGRVELQGSGDQLIVFPNDPPFMIQSCNFVQYVGDYVQPRSASAADGAEDPDFVSLRAWTDRPLPDLAFPDETR